MDSRLVGNIATNIPLIQPESSISTMSTTWTRSLRANVMYTVYRSIFYRSRTTGHTTRIQDTKFDFLTDAQPEKQHCAPFSMVSSKPQRPVMLWPIHYEYTKRLASPKSPKSVSLVTTGPRVSAGQLQRSSKLWPRKRANCQLNLSKSGQQRKQTASFTDHHLSNSGQQRKRTASFISQTLANSEGELSFVSQTLANNESDFASSSSFLLTLDAVIRIAQLLALSSSGAWKSVGGIRGGTCVALSSRVNVNYVAYLAG